MRAGWQAVFVLGFGASAVAGTMRSLGAQATAATPVHAVTAVTARVSMINYSGPCPAKLVFTGTISTSGLLAKPVTYQWLRSDNTKGPERTVKVTGATMTVTEPWQLGRAGEQMRVWKKLEILAPTKLTSSQADAAILCH
jgi:hypothetical protein